MVSQSANRDEAKKGSRRSDGCEKEGEENCSEISESQDEEEDEGEDGEEEDDVCLVCGRGRLQRRKSAPGEWDSGSGDYV